MATLPMTSPQRLWLRTTGGPVEKLDCMYDRNWGTGGELGDAADVAGCDQVGPHSCDVGQFAIPQRGSDLRLQNVVSPRRAAAEVPFLHV